MAQTPAATPGPWFASHREGPDGQYRTEVYCQEGITIATMDWYPVTQPGGIWVTSRAANARLIAAAPDLLAACRLFTAATHAVRDALAYAGVACPASIAFAAEQARHAIAKAEAA